MPPKRAHDAPASTIDVRVRFPGERDATRLAIDARAPTVRAAIEALTKARRDVRDALSTSYAGFEIALSARGTNDDGATLREDAPCAKDEEYVARLTRAYALRATTHPTRKYVVGRFKGERTPVFSVGERAPVEWQMRHAKSDASGNALVLTGGKKGNKGAYTGTRDAQSASYFVLMSHRDEATATVREFVAMPCEDWYTFTHNVQRRVFTLEEAEARMEAGKRAVGEAWGRMDRTVDEPGYSDDESDGDRGEQRDESSDEEDAFKAKKGKKKAIQGVGLDSDDEDDTGKKSGKPARKSQDEGGEDWEHDEEWDDDEDDVAIPEDEEAPKDPTKTHADSDAEDEGLDKEGLAVKKLLGKQEKMQAGQFSDSDSDSELEEDFNPDNDDIAAKVVGSFVERSKKLEAEEKAEAAAQPMAKSTSASSIGVKRSASDVDTAAPLAKTARVAPPTAPKQSPIQAVIIDVVRKNPDSTTVKLITKTCRKKGLLNSTAGAEELKEAIKNLLVMKKLRDGSQVLVLK